MKLLLALGLLLASCASMPDITGGGIPLAKSGWQMTGGADFDKKVWFLMFWRPWGAAEKEANETLLIP
jgi:hypothetical protein